MVKTGLANMAYGVVIALVGALITGVTYAMVSGGGGTYVVAYGAFIVGAWRFLLGLFQVLRGAVSGAGAGNAFPQPPRPASPAPAPASAPRPVVVQEPSDAIHLVGWMLIADAAFRTFGLGSLLWRLRLSSGELFYHAPFLVTAIVLPVIFIVGGVGVGALLLRNLPSAIPLGLGLCAAGLLFQAYGLWGLLAYSRFTAPWLAWLFPAVHITIYLVSLVVLLRASDGRGLAGSPPDAQHTAPGTPSP